jgi:peroxiredoxin Q/BCP
MKTKVLGLLLLGVLTLPAYAALQPGAAAPDFVAQASLAGKAFTYALKEARAKGPVVVYFYPSAFTGGCNLQAHTFAINMDKFTAAGASVIGVSLDSIQRLNDFSADPDYCAGKLPVASDVGGSIAKSFDLMVKDGAPGMKDSRGVVIDHAFSERTTFIVSPAGKVLATVGGVAPDANVQKALEVVQQLHAAK